METINEVTYCPFCGLWQVDVDRTQVLYWRVPSLIDEAVAEHLEAEWDTHRRWALLALAGETCAEVEGCVDGRHWWGCPFGDPVGDIARAMDLPRALLETDAGASVVCRHVDPESDEDCPPRCMMAYGDSFGTVRTAVHGSREED